MNGKVMFVDAISLILSFWVLGVILNLLMTSQLSFGLVTPLAGDVGMLIHLGLASIVSDVAVGSKVSKIIK